MESVHSIIWQTFKISSQIRSPASTLAQSQLTEIVRSRYGHPHGIIRDAITESVPRNKLEDPKWNQLKKKFVNKSGNKLGIKLGTKLRTQDETH